VLGLRKLKEGFGKELCTATGPRADERERKRIDTETAMRHSGITLLGCTAEWARLTK
jgi:hypothetical protein